MDNIDREWDEMQRAYPPRDIVTDLNAEVNHWHNKYRRAREEAKRWKARAMLAVPFVAGLAVALVLTAWKAWRG